MAKRAFTIPVCCLSSFLTAVLSAQPTAQTIRSIPQIHVFSAIRGGPNPLSQTGTVSITGSGSPAWQLTGRQAAWLTVGPRQGTVQQALTFSVSIAGMRAGILLRHRTSHVEQCRHGDGHLGGRNTGCFHNSLLGQLL